MSWLTVVGWISVGLLALGAIGTMALLVGLPQYLEQLGRDVGGPR